MSKPMDRIPRLLEAMSCLLREADVVLKQEERDDLQGKYESLLRFKSETEADLDDLLRDELPLRVALVGTFKAGKSTILNSLLGEIVVGVDLPPATKLISLLRYGEQRKYYGLCADGERVELSASEYLKQSSHQYDKDMKEIRSKGSKYIRFEVEFPAPILRKFHLLDTPGFSSMSRDDDEVTKSELANADLLLWVFDANKGAVSREELTLLKTFEGANVCAIINRTNDKPESRIPGLIESFTKSALGIFDKIIPYPAKPILDSRIRQAKWAEKVNRLFDEVVIPKGYSSALEIHLTPVEIRAIAANPRTILFQESVSANPDEYGGFYFGLLTDALEDWRRHATSIRKNILDKRASRHMRESIASLQEIQAAMSVRAREVERKHSALERMAAELVESAKTAIEKYSTELKESLSSQIIADIGYREEGHVWVEDEVTLTFPDSLLDDVRTYVEKDFKKFSANTRKAVRQLATLFEGWSEEFNPLLECYQGICARTTQDALLAYIPFLRFMKVGKSKCADLLSSVNDAIDMCIADEVLLVTVSIAVGQCTEKFLQNKTEHVSILSERTSVCVGKVKEACSA